MASVPPSEATGTENPTGNWGRPRCGACGHDLTGAVTANACPECGRPLVEVLVRDGSSRSPSYRWQTKATVWGRPAIAVAFGPRGTERRGKARGWIAIGDDAVGVVAIGGIARGIVALGGVAIGACTAGGMSLGLLLGIGGFSISPLGFAFGGVAIGALAVGGMAIGLAATGGLAIGHFAAGGEALGAYPMKDDRPSAASPEAIEFWAALEPIVGNQDRGSKLLIPLALVATAYAAILVSLSFPALFSWWRSEGDDARDRIRRGVS